MELLLQDEAVEPEAIAQWQRRFDAALVTADRGPGLASHRGLRPGTAGRLDAAARTLSAQRDELRKELGLQAQGVRASRATGPP